MHAAWDVAVFERGEVSFPLEPQTDVTCGNAVPLAGAFRTTGKGSMTVCLVWNDGALVDRGALRKSVPQELPHAICKELAPSP
jgi:hypothetical protein